MKFALSSEQRDFFRKSGYVPFSGLMSPPELVALNQGIETSLKGLEKKYEKSHDYFTLGRDLWRRSNEVKKIVSSKRLVELAFELIQKKPIRLAFDQYIPEKNLSLFDENSSLQERSCINDLQGMFLICIKKFPSAQESLIEEGGGIFFLPSAKIPFSSLFELESHRFFMIGYGGAYSQYLYEERDPQVHFLKSQGYVFGDKLNDALNPILLR